MSDSKEFEYDINDYMDEYNEEEVEFQDAFVDTQASTYNPTGLLTNAITIDGNMDKIQKRINHMSSDKNNQFIIMLHTILMDLINKNAIDIPVDAIQHFLQVVHNIPNLPAKNPTALIAAYTATGWGRFLDTPKDQDFDDGLDITTNSRDKSVTVSDLVRYVRLWSTTFKV